MPSIRPDQLPGMDAGELKAEFGKDITFWAAAAIPETS